MRLDKTVTIPNYTEIEVEIETDEVLEDMDMDSIVDYVVANYGNKAVLRHMQHNNDFTEDDIEEAVGRKFFNDDGDGITIEAVIQQIKDGNIDSQELINHIPMMDVEEYVRGTLLYMNKPILLSDISTAMENGRLSQEGIIDLVDDNTYKIVGHENVMKYIHLASPTNKLTMLKAILGDDDGAL